MYERLSLGCRNLAVSLALATLVLAGPYLARAAEGEEQEVDIAGEYSCRGGNAGGEIYSGKVAINKTGQTYQIQWKIGSEEAHAGVGIREGNVLSVCFVSAGGAGVVAYKIEKGEDGPRLVGRWAGLGEQKTQSETLTKGAPLPRERFRGPRRITRSFPHPPAEAI